MLLAHAINVEQCVIFYVNLKPDIDNKFCHTIRFPLEMDGVHTSIWVNPQLKNKHTKTMKKNMFIKGALDKISTGARRV